jgi:hypothetical protein
MSSAVDSLPAIVILTLSNALNHLDRALEYEGLDEELAKHISDARSQIEAAKGCTHSAIEERDGVIDDVR